MAIKTALVALSIVVTGGLWAVSASAQLAPNGQRLLDSITPQERADACAKGGDAISGLVKTKIQQVPLGDRQQAAQQGNAVGQAIKDKCPAK
jgi:hypothetical protein